MANIYCTKKLEKIIGKPNMTKEPGDQMLGNWNGNVFYLKRRKCLILTNDETYYSLLFLNLKKSDILRLNELFYERLIEQLDHDELNAPLSCAAKLLEESEALFLPTNNNRKVLGMMNEFIYQTEYRFYNSYEGDFAQADIRQMNYHLNNYLVGALGSTRYSYGNPIEEMRKKLHMFCERIGNEENGNN